MSEYEIRAYQSEDRDSLLECFNLVFAENNAGFKPRSVAEWTWAFEANPAGKRIWVAACDGKIVGQYAGYPYRVRCDGEDATFSQITDSFAHPEHRRGLKRPGLFVQIGLEYLAATTGPGRDVVTFGWPIEEANRLGERYFQYEVVRTQLLLGRPVGDGSSSAAAGVEPLTSLGPEVRALYDRCAGGDKARPTWGASVIRDAAFIQWRYLDNPFYDYRVYGLRDTSGGLRGLYVYRVGDWIAPKMGILMDWLVPEDDPEAADLLHESFLGGCRADGAESLVAIFPEWSSWFMRFQKWHWKLYPSDLLTVGRQAHRWDMEYLRERWWYQLGETDLV